MLPRFFVFMGRKNMIQAGQDIYAGGAMHRAGLDNQSLATIIRCAPGLAKLAIKELQFRKILHKSARSTVLHQRNHDLIFFKSYGNSKKFSVLRIPEEIDNCVAWGQYKLSSNLLDNVAANLRGEYHLAVTADGRHFNRQDMERWLTKELLRRKVRLSEDGAKILWLFLIDEKFYIAVQEKTYHQAPLRETRKLEREGSLPVTIAAAMAFVGYPLAGETVVDPTCGSGTLLTEAYAFQPAIHKLIGFDTDKIAAEVAKKNLSHVKQSEFHIGDGSATNLNKNSVDLVLANLPFGKQYGTKSSNPKLYADILSECFRVGKIGTWRGIFLTSDEHAFEDAIGNFPELKYEVAFTVKTRGEHAKAYKVTLS